MSEAVAPAGVARPTRRGRLLHKYIALFAVVVCAALLGYGALDIWFIYRDQTASLARAQTAQAEAAATTIGRFVLEIEGQIGWTVQLPWSADSAEQHRFDALRLLRQVPAITDLTQVDAAGREQLRVSRLGMDVIGSQRDLAATAAFKAARDRGVYYGPVGFRRESEPYMTLAVAGARRAAGISIADLNLKFIWDVVSQVRVGERGRAYVIDGKGRLVAHPDIGLVLRNTDLSNLRQTQAAMGDFAERALFAEDSAGGKVFTAFAPVAPVGWFVFIELPLDEAYAPLYSSLRRTGFLLLVGLALAGLVGFFLARRMVVPIAALQTGAARIGAGDLDHRVRVDTGDELETLADSFNTMSGDLAESRARSERLGRFRRFLTAQLADILDSTGGEALLESHRREVTVVFCDLRGFTAFAEMAEPEAVMNVLGEYHRALGALITKYEGTLERFVGDGLMVLFNDPLPCPDPSARAVRMALEMRDGVAALAEAWRASGHALGFGIGIAHGFATMGRIGFEGRFDYSAIGTTPNLAARLCSEAANGQIITDGAVRDAVADFVEAEAVGELVLKGIARPVPAYNMIRLRAEPA